MGNKTSSTDHELNAKDVAKEKFHYMSTSWCIAETHKSILQKYFQVGDITNIIIEYLRCPPNYNIFIHKKCTPLNECYKTIPSKWLQKIAEDYTWNECIEIVLFGSRYVGKSALVSAFIGREIHVLTQPVRNNSDFGFPLSIDDKKFKSNFMLNVPRDQYDNKMDKQSADHPLQNINIMIKDTGDHYYNQIKSLESCGLSGKLQIYLLVFDVTKDSSFDFIKRRYKYILNNAGKEPLCIVVGNKCDLRETEELIKIDMDASYEWIKENELPYIETSAKTKKNVYLLFRTCIYEFWIKTTKTKIYGQIMNPN